MFGDAYDYSGCMDLVMRAGNWIPVPRHLSKALSPAAAILVMHILSTGKVRASGSGWVPATAAYIDIGIGLSSDQQDRILARLEARGIVEVVTRGTPRIRQIRVDTARLRTILGQGESHVKG
jgi:hypothetical protein